MKGAHFQGLYLCLGGLRWGSTDMTSPTEHMRVRPVLGWLAGFGFPLLEAPWGHKGRDKDAGLAARQERRFAAISAVTSYSRLYPMKKK